MKRQNNKINIFPFFLPSKIFSLLFSAFFLYSASSVYATTCNDFDSITRILHISPRLCDSLLKKQDNDFIKVKLILKGLKDRPIDPPKGTDSIVYRKWLDSIYFPWVSQNLDTLSIQADSVLKIFDLRDLEDSTRHLSYSEIKRSELPVILCQIRVSDLIAVTHFIYFGGMEPYYGPKIFGSSLIPNNLNPLIIKTTLKQEYFTTDGRKLFSRIETKGNRPFGVIIVKEILSNGRIVSRKMIY